MHPFCQQKANNFLNYVFKSRLSSSESELKNLFPKAPSLHLDDFNVFPVRGDGNCLFRGISVCTTNTETNHYIIRQSICLFIESEENRFLLYFRNRQSFQNHLLNMKRTDGSNASWGTEIEISAFATMAQCPVFLYTNSASNNYKWVRYTPLFQNSTVPCFSFIALTHNGNHFDALLPKHSCYCLATPPILPAHEEFIDLVNEETPNQRQNHTLSESKSPLVHLSKPDNQTEWKTVTPSKTKRAFSNKCNNLVSSKRPKTDHDHNYSKPDHDQDYSKTYCNIPVQNRYESLEENIDYIDDTDIDFIEHCGIDETAPQLNNGASHLLDHSYTHNSSNFTSNVIYSDHTYSNFRPPVSKSKTKIKQKKNTNLQNSSQINCLENHDPIN